LPGTCDLEAGLCVFPAVDCSSMDSECARGSCELATGVCIAEGINQDALCGAGEVCGPFSVCAPDGVGDVCDTTGVQTHECDVSTCQAGVCTTLDETRTASCTLTTTGITCGEETVVCEECPYLGECDESATQSCTCTTYACAGGTCTASPGGCQRDCDRDTDFLPCFNGTCFNGVCEQEPEPCPFPPCPIDPFRPSRAGR
jgi:hypothetical protein